MSNPKPCIRCGAEFEKCGPRVYCDACQADARKEARARWRARRKADKHFASRTNGWGRPRKTDRKKNLYVNWTVGDQMIRAGADVKDVARTLRVTVVTVCGRRRKLLAPAQGKEPWQICKDPDRSKQTVFVRYMAANPFYFEDIFKDACTRQNVRAAFEKIHGG